MADQKSRRQSQMRVVGLALLGSLLLAGCTILGVRTSGVSGPVEWRTADFEWHGAGIGEEVYTFTLLLRDTQGRDVTFTHLHAILHNAAESLPAYWQRMGEWRLPAHGELSIPLGSHRYCPYARCQDSGPWLVPVWHLTLTGTDQSGQPIKLLLDLRFPLIPNVVRSG